MGVCYGCAAARDAGRVDCRACRGLGYVSIGPWVTSRCKKCTGVGSFPGRGCEQPGLRLCGCADCRAESRRRAVEGAPGIA